MRKFRTFGLEWTFNTGPFTIKEHVMITVSLPKSAGRLDLTTAQIMANVSIGYAYATDALLALKGQRRYHFSLSRCPLLTFPAFYNIDMGWGFQLLFCLSSQLIGISLAGIFRRFLVW